MKMFVPFAAALLIAGPAAAQSSHAAHHPASTPAATAMSGDKGCPKMDEMSGNMQQMMQMDQQMMGQMAQMMQMMQSMQQQHQGMGMTMPKSTPPTDNKPH
jgi:hypothetical protein